MDHPYKLTLTFVNYVDHTLHREEFINTIMTLREIGEFRGGSGILFELLLTGIS
jgi:hypothetical protein